MIPALTDLTVSCSLRELRYQFDFKLRVIGNCLDFFDHLKSASRWFCICKSYSSHLLYCKPLGWGAVLFL